jgi:hypothetical protein
MTATSAATPLIVVRIEGHLRARPQVASDRRATALALFIQSDIQADASAAHDWLDRLDAVACGRVEDDGGTGNAFTLTLDRKGATLAHAIFDEAPEEEFRFTHAEIRSALCCVLEALLTGRRAP